MNKFSAKEVKRSIRNFESAAQDILSAQYSTYESRIEKFIEITRVDPVINSIVGPLFLLKIDLEKIHVSGDDLWIELKLPTNTDEELAYVVQMFDLITRREISLDNIAFGIYRNNSFSQNISLWMSDVARPNLRELSYRLNDLVEDEVSGKEEVATAALQIFNYGSINASHGSSVAMGKDIHQTINYKNVANEIMDKVRAEQAVSEDKLDQVEEASNELQEELAKAAPSPSRLTQLAGKFYELGEAGLLKVVSTVVTDPKWGQAVGEALMNVMM
ncbi:hypothetical protein [Priestia megaterium]|uniref:hypothetical protein n=1 Tax=Priestia megaterium TaxID=1404 RepID=UPI002D7F4D7D|nr:hypothetical protein [Priestia megaterium]MEB4859751.1 hypothetical protein [Priestia megaterium]